MMRVVRLRGRLGNNLFQYALLRGEGEDRQVLVDDLRASADPLIEVLKPGRARRITAMEALRLRQPPRLPKGRPWLRKFNDHFPQSPIVRYWNSYVYNEVRQGTYDPRAHQIASPVIFAGFFQNEDYFRSEGPRIADDLRAPGVDAMKAIFGAASRGRSPTVAVVVRAATDYVSRGWNQTSQWYLSAAEHMVDTVGSASFVVFSDVPDAAASTSAALASLGPSVAALGHSVLDQLHGISLADHAVISASTFAWWGAWLGDQRVAFDGERVVVAPRPWITPAMNGVAPSRWVALPESTTVDSASG